VKLNRPTLAIALLTACIMSSVANACPDDPERCVERGATVSHRTVAVVPATASRATVAATSTPTHASPAVTTTARKAPTQAAPTRKAASKPARTVSPAAPAPATPGMGMLLKLQNGSTGDVSLFPSAKPNEKENTSSGVSWVL
jgi:hypothetical protein